MVFVDASIELVSDEVAMLQLSSGKDIHDESLGGLSDLLLVPQDLGLKIFDQLVSVGDDVEASCVPLEELTGEVSLEVLKHCLLRRQVAFLRRWALHVRTNARMLLLRGKILNRCTSPCLDRRRWVNLHCWLELKLIEELAQSDWGLLARVGEPQLNSR